MEDRVMIGFLPVTNDWCRIEVPHMTLVFAGKKSDLESDGFNEIIKDTSMLAAMNRPLYLRVTGKAVFGSGVGDDPQVDVFTLLPTPELWAMRRSVEKWNKSEHPFRPHVTIGPTGQPVEFPPGHLAFDRIVAGWGDEYVTFNLRG